MKRKILAALCAVMLLVSAASCTDSGGKDASAGGIRLFGNYFNFSKYDSKTNNTYLDCRGSTVYCTEETAKAYPQLAAALDNDADNTLKYANKFLRIQFFGRCARNVLVYCPQYRFQHGRRNQTVGRGQGPEIWVPTRMACRWASCSTAPRRICLSGTTLSAAVDKITIQKL